MPFSMIYMRHDTKISDSIETESADIKFLKVEKPVKVNLRARKIGVD